MRSASRLLAAVQRSSQFLEPGAPTGLTGLVTHVSPRTALLYLYNTTLDTLKQFPEHSVYRQSTEALTKHRLQILESTKPAGLEEWQQRVKELVDSHPDAFRKLPVSSGAGSSGYNIVWKEMSTKKTEQGEDGDIILPPAFAEGPKTDEEAERVARQLSKFAEESAIRVPEIENEPSLTAAQIGELETKINAGLIEEVIQVAEGEKHLADVLLSSQAWEDLEEKPVDGQWTYHERDRHTAGTA